MKQLDEMSVTVLVTVTNYGAIFSSPDEVKIVLQEGDVSGYNGELVLQYPF